MRNYDRNNSAGRIAAILSAFFVVCGFVVLLCAFAAGIELLAIIGADITLLSVVVGGICLWITEPAPVDQKDSLFIGAMILMIIVGMCLVFFGIYSLSATIWGSLLLMGGIGLVLISSGWLKDHLLGLRIVYRYDQVRKIK